MHRGRMLLHISTYIGRIQPRKNIKDDRGVTDQREGTSLSDPPNDIWLHSPGLHQSPCDPPEDDELLMCGSDGADGNTRQVCTAPPVSLPLFLRGRLIHFGDILTDIPENFPVARDFLDMASPPQVILIPFLATNIRPHVAYDTPILADVKPAIY